VLNVRSTESDLTAAARIRDAAIAEFGIHGMQRATVRGIAEAAGVSAGLVLHHFGSKDGLRGACNEYVLGYLHDQIVAEEAAGNDPGVFTSAVADSPLIVNYLVAVLGDGGDAAATVFDRIVDLTEDYFDRRSAAQGHPLSDFDHIDNRTLAVIMTSMSLGMYVLNRQVSRALGTDMFGPAGIALAAGASLDIVNPKLVDPAVTASARAAIAQFVSAEAGDTTTNHPTTGTGARTRRPSKGTP
jgi:AcrR family transcriptional regulator